MAKIRLGVNIDHVATLRNARGEEYPSPLKAAIFAGRWRRLQISPHPGSWSRGLVPV